MSRNRSVLANILWNFAGNALPLLAGLLAFPLLLKGLGVDRFGVLSIAWVLVGYFSLFDLGLSRAVTYIVSKYVALGEMSSALGAAATALRLTWLLGFIAAAIIGVLASQLTDGLLEIPTEIQREAIASFYVLAISIPFVIHSGGLRGILEAHHSFRSASIVRMSLGVGTFMGPLLAVSFGGDLVAVIWILVAIRIAAWFAYLKAVSRHIDFRSPHFRFERKWLRPLLTFGGWMTVTNVVSPLMVYLDRFVIAAKISIAAVSYYIVPYEVVTRAWVIPAAITGVLFPLLSASWSTEKEKNAEYLNKAIGFLVAVLFPALGILSYFAPELFSVWLGEEFAHQSTAILRWLAASTLIGSVAQVYFALIQGAGRSDWTGKLHLVEAIPYWFLLVYMLDEYGVVGAAVAYFARTAVDAVGMMWLATRLDSVYLQRTKIMALHCVIAALLLFAPMQLADPLWRAIVLVISSAVLVLVVWHSLFSYEERQRIKKIVMKLLQKATAGKSSVG